MEKCIADRKISEGKKAVFPCVLKIVAVYHLKKPIVLGVEVQDGIVKIGTPICVPEKDVNYLTVLFIAKFYIELTFGGHIKYIM